MTPHEITQARIAKGWTQKQLAEAMKVSERTIGMWEAGDRNLSGSAEKLFTILISNPN